VKKKKNMKPIATIFTSILLAFTSVQSSSGQDEMILMNDKYGGAGYFMPGASMLNVNNLNAMLNNAGYPSLSGNLISYGGGGHGVWNRWVIGGHGHSLVGTPENSNNYTLDLAGGMGFIDFGYTLFTRPKMDIYPLLGIGLGGITLDIAEDTPQDFMDLLNNPDSGTEISQGGFLLDFSINATYLIDMADLPFEREGLIIGLQGGYVLDPTDNTWYMNGNEVSNGPVMNMSGPYLRLLVGGGGFNYPEIAVEVE
jgi:hypothetical protein